MMQRKIRANSRTIGKLKQSALHSTTCLSGGRGITHALAVGLAVLWLTDSQPVLANPQNGVVVDGNATIQQNGTTTTINQSSQNVSIDWQSFSIGSGETTQFIQPNSSAIAINRVTGSDPSSILGNLTANGRVILINPNGIFFEQGSQIDVSGLLATTSDFEQSNFDPNVLNFTIPTTVEGAEVINEGNISVNDGGFAALVAPRVRNNGTIVARLGKVTLASGNTYTLDLRGDQLIQLELPTDPNLVPDDVSVLVENAGRISAEGGIVALKAKSIGDLLKTVVNTSGIIEANSFASNQGKVVLSAVGDGGVEISGSIEARGLLAAEKGGLVEITANNLKMVGDIDASSQLASGGKVTVDSSGFVSLGGNVTVDGRDGGTVSIKASDLSAAETVSAKGTTGTGGVINLEVAETSIEVGNARYDASGVTEGGSIRHVAQHQITSSASYDVTASAGKGGNVDISANTVKLLSATVDASGATGGGRIRVGGEFQGGKDGNEELLNAEKLAGTTGTQLKADATGDHGDGGEVIVWSDNNTTFLGDITAVPGLLSGDGGFVELSSAGTLTFNGVQEIQADGSKVTSSARITVGDGDRAGTVLFDPKNITIVDQSFSQYSLILGFNYSKTNDFGEIINPGDSFGSAVSLDGNMMAVAATGDDGDLDTGGDRSAIYLISFDDLDFNGGKLEGLIGAGYTGGKNIDTNAFETNNSFAAAISLDQNRLVASATLAPDGGANTGAVHMFTFADDKYTSGAHVGKMAIGASGGQSVDITSIATAGGNFGTGLSLDGRNLAVGERNSDVVHIFQFNDLLFNTVNFEGTIGLSGAGSNGLTISGVSVGTDSVTVEAGDRFGQTVALQGRQLVVGATFDDGVANGGVNSGAVYLINFDDAITLANPTVVKMIGRSFDGSGTSLNAAGFSTGLPSELGAAVSIDNNMLAVGSIDGGGRVHLFSMSDASYNGLAEAGHIGTDLNGANDVNTSGVTISGDGIGNTGLSLDNFRLAIGASGDDGESNSAAEAGAVHIFKFDDALFNNGRRIATFGHGYADIDEINVSVLVSGNNFGKVSLDGQRMAVVSDQDDGFSNSITGAGAIYLFTFTDTQFAGGKLEGIVGHGYTGGKNVDISGTLEANDRIGSVSIDGNNMAVGAFGDDGFTNGGPTGSGAVHLFTFADSVFSSGSQIGSLGVGYTGSNSLNLNTTLDANDNFGASVALDGTRLLVGATGDDGNNDDILEGGAVHVFTFASTALDTPFLRGTIGADYSGTHSKDVTNIETNDNFGTGVSISGNAYAIGASNDDGIGGGPTDNKGAVYIFTTANATLQTPTEIAILGSNYTGGNNINLSGNLDNGDLFGESVALEGTNLVVGTPGDDGFAVFNTDDKGAVYVFNFTDTTYVSGSLNGIIGANYVGANDLNINEFVQAGDKFGFGISLSGQQLVVGATGDDGLNNDLSDSGAVHFLRFNNANLTNGFHEGSAGFGYVGLDGNADLSADGSPDAGDKFGSSVALDGTRMVVGAIGDDGNGDFGADFGAVYLFTFDNTEFEGAKLEGVIGAGYNGDKNIDLGNVLNNSDKFGSAVSLDGTNLVIGSPGDDGASNIPVDSGAVLTFTFADLVFSGGTHKGTIGLGYGTDGNNLEAATLETLDAFGTSVALEGNRLLVGTPGDDGDSNVASASGAVYAILFSSGNMTTSGASTHAIIGHSYVDTDDIDLSGQLVTGDGFGQSVAMDGQMMVAGAPFDDTGASDAGLVYAFTMSNGTDFTGLALDSEIGSGVTVTGNNIDMGGAVAEDDNFGMSVSLDLGILAIGATGDDGFGADNLLPDSQGAVHIITYNSTTAFTGGSVSGTIGTGYTTAPDVDVTTLGNTDQFGSAVALQNGNLVVGASHDSGVGDVATEAGAVYFFLLDAGQDPVTEGSFGDNQAGDSVFTAKSIEALLKAGTNVVLQASNNITMDNALIDSTGGVIGASLSFLAGGSIDLSTGDITLNDGDLSLTANAGTASGVIDAERDIQNAVILMTTSTDINTGLGNISVHLDDGTGQTNSGTADITLGHLFGNAISIQHSGSAGNIVNASSETSVLLVASSSIDIRMSNASGDITTTIDTPLFEASTTGGDISLIAFSNFTIGGATAAINGIDINGGNLTLNSTSGVFIDQTEAITAVTIFELNNNTGNTILADPGNNFGTLRTNLNTPGSRNNDVVLNESDGFQFGNTTFGTDGNLDVTSGNAIEASATALQIVGVASFNTSASLNLGAANVFDGLVLLNAGGSVNLTTAANMALGTGNIGGNLDIIATGFDVTGTGGITANLLQMDANTVSLTGANDFTDLRLTGNNFTLNDINAVNFDSAGTNVSGVLTLSTAGDIRQTATVIIGSADFNAGAGDIVMDQSGNNIAAFGAAGGNDVTFKSLSGGTFTLTGLNIAGNADFETTGATSFNQATNMNVGGDFTLNVPAGAILLDNVSNVVGGSVILTTSNNADWAETGNQQFGAVNVAGTLSVEGTDGIIQTAAMTAGTLSVINLTGDVFLGDAGNNFTTVDIQSGTNISIHNGAGGPTNYNGINVTGSVNLASNRDLTQSGAFTIGGNLDINMAGGAKAAFGNTGNDVAGTVNLSDGGGTAYDTAWTENGDVVLGNVAWAGASTATIESVNGNINALASGVVVGGNATFNANNGGIQLTAAGNNFSGNVAFTGTNAVDILAVGTMDIGSSNTVDDINLTADGLTISGSLTSSTGNVNLESTHGQDLLISGSVSATTGVVTTTSSHFDLDGTISAPAGVVISYLGDNNSASDFFIEIDQNAVSDVANPNLAIDGTELANITTNALTITREGGDHSVAAFLSRVVDFSSFGTTILDLNGIQLNQVSGSSISAVNLTLNATSAAFAAGGSLQDGRILSDFGGVGTYANMILTGDLAINAGDFDIQANTVSVSGTTTIASGAGRPESVLTGSTTSSLTGDVTILGGEDIKIRTDGNLVLASAALNGNLQIQMDNGTLSQTGDINTATLQLVSVGTGTFNANLINSGNTIGALALFDPASSGGSGDYGNVSVNSTSDLGIASLDASALPSQSPLPLVTSGNLILTSDGQIRNHAGIPIDITANSVVMTGATGINLAGSLTATASMTLTASSGDIVADTLTADNLSLSAGNEMNVASANAASSFTFNATGFGFSDSGSSFNGSINAFTPPVDAPTAPENEEIVDDIPVVPDVDTGGDVFTPDAPPENGGDTGNDPAGGQENGGEGSGDDSAADGENDGQNGEDDTTDSQADEENDGEEEAEGEGEGDGDGEDVAGDPEGDAQAQSAEEQTAAENLAGDSLETGGDVVFDENAADLSADATLLAEGEVKSDGELQDSADATGDEALAETTTEILDILGDAADTGATGAAPAQDVAAAPAGAYSEPTTLVPGLLVFEPEPVAAPAAASGGAPAPAPLPGSAPEPVAPVSVAAVSETPPAAPSGAPSATAGQAGGPVDTPVGESSDAAPSGGSTAGSLPGAIPSAGPAPLDGLGDNGSLPPNFGYMGSF